MPSSFSDKSFVSQKRSATGVQKPANSAKIDALLNESSELLESYYDNKTNGRVKDLLNEINKIKKDNNKKNYIYSNINEADLSCNPYKKLGVLIGGTFIVDEFFKFDKVKQDMPAISSGKDSQFLPHSGGITCAPGTMENRSQDLINGINIGIHEFTHALRSIRNDRKLDAGYRPGDYMIVYALSEFATCYNIISYGLPFKKQPDSVDLYTYWPSTLRNINTLPQNAFNASGVIKKEYIAYMMCPWIYDYIKDKKEILDLGVNSDSVFGINVQRGQLLYWTISKQIEAKDSPFKDDFMRMFTEETTKPEGLGQEIMKAFDNYFTTTIFNNKDYPYKEVTSNRYGNSHYLKIPDTVDIDSIMVDGLGLSSSNKLRSVIEDKFKKVIEELKADRSKMNNEQDFLNAFIKAMNKHFGQAHTYKDVPKDYI